MSLFYGSAILCQGKAILIRGTSGSGKSDLTLRYLWQFAPYVFEKKASLSIEKVLSEQGQDQKFGFISDDQVLLERVQIRDKTQIIACAPKTISGLLEVRGVGIIKLPAYPKAPVSLVITLSPLDIPRFLDAAAFEEDLLGVNIPVIALNPFEQSAPLKMKLALELYGLKPLCSGV